MDGVLEATVTLCGCKVLCSFLCLPAFKNSISSVSLCCSCLLFFTDLSITVFLVYLWTSAPRPVFFHPSSDVIALHFMLFLSNTYWAVLLLTPLLLVLEVLVHLLWPGVDTRPRSTKPDQSSLTELLMEADGEALEREPIQEDKRGILLKALGFIGCLVVWVVSGVYAGSSWKQDQLLVSECLDRGGSLSACLPCLLTSFSPIRDHHLWFLAAILLLLGLTGGLSLVQAQFSLLEEPQVLRNGCEWIKLNRMKKRNSVGFRIMKMLQRTSNFIGNLNNINKSSQCRYIKQRWHLQNSLPLSSQTSLAKLQSKGFLLVSQLQTEPPLKATKAVENPGRNLNSHKSQLCEPHKESPGLKAQLMTGLLCALLLCVFPTVLSTNILLISNLEMLVVYAVKHLLIQRHSQ